MTLLSRLHIENIAVIKNADLDLANGFNVLTGETGAGKSILIDSINLALGERVSKDIVRAGTSTAHVSALFSELSEQVSAELAALGYDCTDELLIQRDISADGRGSCRISGRPATVSILRSVGRMLVNIHGQHENQALLSPEKHIAYLDRFAGTDELLKSYSEAFRQTKMIAAELDGIETDAAQKERRIDLLKYQIEEIESAGLQEDEEEELRAKKLRIVHAEKIASAVSGASAALCGDEDNPGAQAMLFAADSALDGVADVLPDIAELAGRIKSLCYELEDCADDLHRFLTDEEYDPNELESIEERMDTIFRLKKKYGGTIEEVLQFLNASKKELEKIETSDERAAGLRKKLATAKETLHALAADLSEQRRKAAKLLALKIREELSFLDMLQVEFSVDFKPLLEPASYGIDDIEFLISPNPGSPARPLAKIASGGELSRVMLAIKTVLANSDGIETLIFDEIDTGVSGRAAQKIGNKLRQVSKDCQVVCVTHLAQIASQADRHILIEKQVEKGNTFTSLKTLDYSGRQRELARIIGSDVTEKTLQAAAEMLSLNTSRDKT
jgi:DNA repair protein RecN (Recombination protein N)